MRRGLGPALRGRAGRVRLILASASPRRLELLARIGVVPAAVDPADADEAVRPGERPRAHVERLAAQKAAIVASRHPGCAVLAADTIVVTGHAVLPKAEDEGTARACLVRLSGRRHRVLTAVTVIDAAGVARHRLSTTRVVVARLGAAEIAAYLASGEWRGKAGGYAIQGRFEAHVRRIDGSFSGVMGLPLFETAALLRTAGVRA